MGYVRQCFRLGGAATDARDARRNVEDSCVGLPVEVIEAATLLASELVTNAFEHGEGPLTLDLMRSNDGIRVEVGDGSPGRPQVGDPAHDETGGRGLLLVEQHARAWGVDAGRPGRGKTVWFTLGTDIEELPDR